MSSDVREPQRAQPVAPKASSDVFISYSSQDKAVADAICDTLENVGVACWMAPRDVTPGDFYAESIVRAIDSAKVVVLVLSQNAAVSQHVLREVERASSKRRPVVSFRVDREPLPAGLEYFLNTTQWLDASATGVDQALPKLVDAVQGALARCSEVASVNPGPSSPRATIEAPPKERSIASVWDRIKHHKMVQWTIAYLALAYTLLHGAEMLGNSFGWSHGLLRLFTLILILGVPVVITLAWYHGARGQQRASGTEIMTIAVILAVGGAILWRDNTTEHDSYGPATSSPAQTPTIATDSVISTTGVAAGPNEKSIAVLPFVNMSSDKEQEYLADGISEELLNLLVQVPDLRVIARTSSFAFKGQNIAIADIAERLNVAHVLEGSVRKSGNKIRITAQLVRTSDSSHLWSQTYDRELTDVFEIQDQIAASVVAELKARLLGAVPKARITDPIAYALFLQAREIGRQSTKVGYEKSNKLYQQVLALDPGYVAAWEGLASNYINQAFYGLVPVDEGIQLAREATNKALALEPARATSLLSLSYIASHYDLDLRAAAQHLGAALALEPTNPDVLAESGALMRRLTRLDEAIAIGEYQLGLDPVNLFGYEILGTAYQYAGRLDDALAAWRTILNLSPNYVGAHEGAGEILLAKGDTQAALSEMQQEVLSGFRLIGLSMANHALGKEKESDAALMESIQKHSREYPFMIAYAYAYRGEADRAFEWLHKAVEYHDLLFVAVAGHPFFAKIHSDPRWLPFLRKHGMAPEQLAVIKFEVEVPD